MNEVIIKQSKKRGIQLIILGIIMMIMCIFVLTMGIIDVSIIPISIGIIGTVFFGLCFSFIVKTFILKTPLLLIGDEGITDMSTATSVGFIAWDEIQSISVEKYFKQKYIEITVYDPLELSRRISVLKRVAMKVNKIVHFPPVLILLDISNIEFNEAVSLMQKRLEENRTK